MKQFVKKKIGNETLTYEVEGATLFDCQTEAQKLSFEDVECCGICQSKNLKLNAKTAQKKFKYLEVQCKECRATLTFGQKMEDPTIFYLRKTENKELDWKKFDFKSFEVFEKES